MLEIEIFEDPSNSACPVISPDTEIVLEFANFVDVAALPSKSPVKLVDVIEVAPVILPNSISIVLSTITFLPVNGVIFRSVSNVDDISFPSKCRLSTLKFNRVPTEVIFG